MKYNLIMGEGEQAFLHFNAKSFFLSRLRTSKICCKCTKSTRDVKMQFQFFHEAQFFSLFKENTFNFLSLFRARYELFSISKHLRT